jgi:D-aminopeptidase
MARKPVSALGIRIGSLSPGPLDAITDVQGVRVGHATLVSGEGLLRPGFGPVRTGVTVVLPHSGNLYLEKVRAAVHTINGYGKVCGFEQVRELGVLEAPLALTNTLNVGLVLDALVQASIRQNPQLGIAHDSGSINIVVGETNDSYLNDIQGCHVHAEHVFQALESARSGPVQMGAVGAGAGTVCYGWKGGIGSASRRLPADLGGYTLGALVQSNFGRRPDLLVNGVPVGRFLTLDPPPPVLSSGSVMIVLATDAPLSSRQLGRLCVRAAAGLARTGGYLTHGSGDFVIAFSTTVRLPHRPASLTTLQTVLVDEAPVLNGLFQAVIESVEESVLNSLTCAETVLGRDNHLAQALPLDQLQDLLYRHNRLLPEE